MYSKIQVMKEQEFSTRQVSRTIRISRNTISKFWEMKPEEYAEAYKAVNRMTALTAYEPVVVKWLETYPCMTAAQVRDWLEERHQLDAGERTVRRFVARIWERYGITRKEELRRYIKLYFVVFTLSYSRYKWGLFQERPFISTDLVRALYGCFYCFGGMPQQLVYDQDSIIVVSDNGGDIIHTQAFAAFLAETKLDVRVCRKSDPESKGMIVAKVKFVKGNFMENRLYMGIELWNQSFEDWLERQGTDREWSAAWDDKEEAGGHVCGRAGAAAAIVRCQ